MTLVPSLSHPPNPGTPSLARVGSTTTCLSLIVVLEGPLR